MKRSIDSLSGRTSAPSSPPPSPRRRRPGASSSAGPSELARPDDLPSSRPPSPGGLDESSARRAGVLPTPLRAATLTDVPRSAFQSITRHLGILNVANLMLADPTGLGPLVSDEVSAMVIVNATRSVDRLAQFTSLLGAGAHAAHDTILSIDGWPRSVALGFLIDRVEALPVDERFPAFALAAQAAHQVPVRDRPRVIVALLPAVPTIAPEQRHDAWHALLPVIESLGLEPEAFRLDLTRDWVDLLGVLPAAHRDDAAQTAFDAVARLPVAQQVPVLHDLLDALVALEDSFEPRIVRAAVEAVTRVPLEHGRPQLLSSLSRVMSAVPPGAPDAMAESERRAFMRTLRGAIADLPDVRQPMPLNSLAQKIELLPEHERHLEMDRLLRQITHLADAHVSALNVALPLETLIGQIVHVEPMARASAWHQALPLALSISRAAGPLTWAKLIDQLEHVEPRRRIGLLIAAHARIAHLPDVDEPSTLLPALLPVRRLALEQEREDHFDRGLQWTRALPMAGRFDALRALIESIRHLPVESFARATEQLAHAVVADARPRRNPAFDVLVQSVGGLALAGLPQGFEILHGAIDALADVRRPPLLVALAQGVAYWPPAGQTDRFVRLVNASRDLGPATQGDVLEALAYRVRTLPLFERETFMSFALAMSAELPAELRWATLHRLMHSIDQLPADERPQFARRSIAAVVALPDDPLVEALDPTVRTLALLARDGRWPESFTQLLEAAAEEPLVRRTELLTTLVNRVTLWPSDDLPRYFALLRAQLPTLRPPNRAELLSELANRIGVLDVGARPTEAAALRAAIENLPPALRRAPANALRRALGEH